MVPVPNDLSNHKFNTVSLAIPIVMLVGGDGNVNTVWALEANEVPAALTAFKLNEQLVFEERPETNKKDVGQDAVPYVVPPAIAINVVPTADPFGAVKVRRAVVAVIDEADAIVGADNRVATIKEELGADVCVTVATVDELGDAE